VAQHDDDRTYFAAMNLFSSRLLTRATKVLLYMTLISGIWSGSMDDDEERIFERKIFRRIYSPKYENEGMEK
jgi:hypothetical protein